MKFAAIKIELENGKILIEGHACVGEASNGKEVIDILSSGIKADVVILGMNMPEMNGLETSKCLQAHYSDIKILVLIMMEKEHYVYRLMKAGMKGYLIKSAGKKEFLFAIRKICIPLLYTCNVKSLKILVAEKNDKLKRFLPSSGSEDILKQKVPAHRKGEVVAGSLSGWIDCFRTDGFVFATATQLVFHSCEKEECSDEYLSYSDVISVNRDVNEVLSETIFRSRDKSICVTNTDHRASAEEFCDRISDLAGVKRNNCKR